jgi:hypothetical protein
MNRVSVLAALLAVICIPKAALADRQSDKKAFIASCDESISIARLFGAPRKFVGKHVDIRGIVGPATDNPKVININDIDNLSLFVIVLSDDLKDLEQGQRVRILGEVGKPVTAQIRSVEGAPTLLSTPTPSHRSGSAFARVY